jgi:hypothetical protein
VLAAAACGFVLLVASGAAVPELFYDALSYHLGLPAQYQMTGRIVAEPFLLYSAFPAYVDVLLGVFLGLGGPALAKSFVWLIYLLCGAAVCLLRDPAGLERGDLSLAYAVLILLSVPGIAMMSTMCGIDTALMFFSTMAFAGLARALAEAGAGGRRRWLVAAALPAGVVAGSKYTGLVVLFAMVLTLLVSLGGSLRRRIGLVSVFSAIGLAVAGPWYLRNLLVLGNPVYPALANWLGPSPTASWVLERIQRDLAPHALTPRGILELLRAQLLDPTRFGAGAELGLLLPLGLPAMLVAVVKLPRWRPFVLLFAAFWLVWLTQHTATRYLYPIMPVAAASAAWMLGRLGRHNRALRSVVAGVVLLAALANGVRVASKAYGFYGRSGKLLRYFARQVSAEQYLAGSLDYYPMARWVREHLATDARLLFLGETRPLYYGRRVIYSSAYDRHVVQHWLEEASGYDQFEARVTAAGVTHLLIHRPELARLRQRYGYLALSEPQDKLLRELLSHCRVLHSDHGILVCELEPQGAAAPSPPPP